MSTQDGAVLLPEIVRQVRPRIRLNQVNFIGQLSGPPSPRRGGEGRVRGGFRGVQRPDIWACASPRRRGPLPRGPRWCGGSVERSFSSLSPSWSGQPEAAHHRLLGVAERDGRLLRDRAGELLRRLHQLGRRHHALDEADTERLGRGTRAPVRIISSALPRPTRRGSRWWPPPPGMMPRLISVRPSGRPQRAMRMSQARASSSPPPSA